MERYDLTVTALDLAFGFRDRESMPRDIQDRLLLAAGSFFRNGSQGTSTATSADAIFRSLERFSLRHCLTLRNCREIRLLAEVISGGTSRIYRDR